MAAVYPIRAHVRNCVQKPSAQRLKSLAQRLHGLGVAPLFHFLDEFIADGADLWGRLEVYARLDPDFIEALGGRDLPPVLHVIEQDP